MNLRAHPATPSVTVSGIEASVWRTDDHWHFRYLVEGASSLIILPAHAAERSDGLWQATCFEAFIGLDGATYLELNFSPSGQWAAYRFVNPRTGMRDEPAGIEVWLEGGEDWIAVEAAVCSTALHPAAPVGLTAVIEETGGHKSYWALAHPSGPPDFHDPSCFIARLPE